MDRTLASGAEGGSSILPERTTNLKNFFVDLKTISNKKINRRTVKSVDGFLLR